MTQRLALVTGGLHRVGAAIAARLAREGYALALHKHSLAEPDAVLVEALAETGAGNRHFTADLSDPAAVDALVPQVIDAFGRAPDLLVNNAALFAEGEWQGLTQPGLAAMMQLNLHRSEEHKSELQSLMRRAYAVFCLKKKTLHH